jgi:hypothetical protein
LGRLEQLMDKEVEVVTAAEQREQPTIQSRAKLVGLQIFHSTVLFLNSRSTSMVSTDPFLLTLHPYDRHARCLPVYAMPCHPLPWSALVALVVGFMRRTQCSKTVDIMTMTIRGRPSVALAFINPFPLSPAQQVYTILVVAHMYQPSLLSLIYPASVFGYALLQNPRSLPRIGSSLFHPMVSQAASTCSTGTQACKIAEFWAYRSDSDHKLHILGWSTPPCLISPPPVPTREHELEISESLGYT